VFRCYRSRRSLTWAGVGTCWPIDSGGVQNKIGVGTAGPLFGLATITSGGVQTVSGVNIAADFALPSPEKWHYVLCEQSREFFSSARLWQRLLRGSGCCPLAFIASQVESGISPKNIFFSMDRRALRVPVSVRGNSLKTLT
jgi:hypothetical protein